MQATCFEVDGQTRSVLAGVAPSYHEAVRELGYGEAGGEFLRTLPVSTPHLDRVRQNFGKHAEAMILQTARVEATPWEAALEAFLDRVEPHELDWWLGGSAALAVRGLSVVPRDFDVVIAERDAEQLGSVLLEHLDEPVTPGHWFCRWWGRAFLHARIEWVGGVDERADQPTVSDFGPTAASRLETVAWRGHALRVPPLELQLEVSRRRGLTNRAEEIERTLNI